MNGTRKTRRTARQLFRLCVVGGTLDVGRVRQVAAGVAASGRRGALAVLSDFQRMVRLERERHTAIVQSAAALPDDVRREVAANLTRMYGAGLETSFEENPVLLGGMRIQVGSDVYDGSVRARLAAIDAAWPD
jgi:F-type H+-transporting ATPase subunit delta